MGESAGSRRVSGRPAYGQGAARRDRRAFGGEGRPSCPSGEVGHAPTLANAPFPESDSTSSARSAIVTERRASRRADSAAAVVRAMAQGAIGEAIVYAVNQPSDVDVNEIVVRPVAQG